MTADPGPRRPGRSWRVLRRLSVAEARKRPGRVLVTLGTVALGAGALTSALTLGASVQRAVEDGIRVEFTNVDVLQRSDQAAGEDSAGGGAGASVAVSPDAVAAISAIDGVREVGTAVRTSAVARTGDIVRGISLDSLNTAPEFVWQRWAEGRPPRDSTEIALTQHTLDEMRIGLGDLVNIGLPSTGSAQYRVVGVVDTRGSLDRLGSTYGVVTEQTAQQLAGVDGPNTVTVDVDRTSDVPQVIDEVNRVAPIGLPQSGPDILSARRAIQLGQINALSATVAALAAVSSLVAAITSATTTGASLATRRRTWALLRCVGASRTQIGGLVVAEALVLGLLGALLGVLGGLAVARLALPLVGLVPGLPPLRGDAFTVTASAVALPVVLSVVLALAAAVVPVFLAARIPPSAALKESSSAVVATTRRRAVTAVALVVLGAATALASARTSTVLVVVGLVLLLVGAALLLVPILVWVARMLAGRSRSVAVRLGFLDVVRRPRAAAIEAVAVLLATGMISLTWVALGSVQEATAARLSTSPSPDLTVGAVVGPPDVSAETLAKLQALDGVEAAVAVPFGPGVTLQGKGTDGRVTLSTGTAAGDERTLGSALPGGLPIDVRDDTVYIDESAFPPFYAKTRVTLTGPDGTVRGLRVSYVKDLGVPTLVSPTVLASVTGETDLREVWLALAAGADRATVVDQVTGIAITGGQLPVSGPVVLDIRVANGISTARAAAVAILSVAVLVAVVGAAATGALSIRERSREHATLRALGLDRAGLGRLLATRVLFVSGVAAGLGVLVGGTLGIVASRMVLLELGLEPRVALPVLAIAAVVALTVFAVRVAALIPMERASYVPPTRALAQG